MNDFHASAHEEQVDEVIAAYLEAERAGQAPHPDQLLAQHPDLASELRSFFADRRCFARLAGPPAYPGDGETPTQEPPAQSLSTVAYEASPSAAGPMRPPELADFGPLEEIARGGMGIVYRVRDPHLGRDLAVKILRPDRQDRPDLARRFVEEAKITGQLQHPGVAPIHALGQTPDGRPFFTMKLIRGQTFAQLLAKRSTPADDLPRFLKIYEQVCQTLAYAHSQGIIHRDLKPANIMVGAFGEVQVMDWGLAKVVARDEWRVTSEKAGATGEGHGANEGLPPADNPPPSAEPETQPWTPDTPDSPALAPVLPLATHAGQVIGTPAYMPPEQARGDTNNVTERSDVFGLGAILCEILTGRPPYWSNEEGKKAREEVEEKARNADLAKALAALTACGAESALIDLAKACLAPNPNDRPSDAEEVAKRIEAHLAAVQERLHQEREQRAAAEVKAEEEAKRGVVERQKRRRTQWLAAATVAVVVVGGAGIATWLHQQSLRQAEERRTRESVESTLAQLPALYERYLWKDALALLDRADKQLGPDGDPDLRVRLAHARGDTTFIKVLDDIRLDRSVLQSGKWDYDAARAAALTTYRQVFLDQGLDVLEGEPADLAATLTASAVRNYLLAALDDWAMTEGTANRERILAVSAQATGQEWRRRLHDVWQDGKRLAKLYDAILTDQRTPALIWNVGRRLNELGEDGIRRIEEGLRQYPSDFWLHFELGWIGGKERLAARIGAYRAALALRPQTAAVHHNLGIMHYEAKHYDAAIAEYQEAIRLDPNFARPHNGLGTVLYDKKQYDAAIAAYQEAIRLDPNSAHPHNGLGNVLDDKKQYDAAIAAYQEAIRLDPNDALPHSNLGNVFHHKKQYDAAIAAYKEASRLDPNLGMPYNNLGNVLAEKKQYDAAIAAYQEAIRLDPSLARPHNGLGNVLATKKQYDAAIAAFKEAIRLDPNNALPHNGLGNVLDDKKQYDAAIAEYKEAIRLDPNYAAPHHGLGQVLRTKKQYFAAIAEHKEAIRLDPNYAEPHHGLGKVLHTKKQYDAAIAEYKEAIRLDPNYAEPHNDLGNVLADQKQYDAAIAEYKEAIRLDPNLAPPHNNLGMVLADQKQHAAAIAAYKEAIRLDPNFAHAHNGLGTVLYDQKQYDAASDSFKEAIRLDPTYPFAYANLGLAYRDLGRFADSVGAFRQAASLMPGGTLLQTELRVSEQLLSLEQRLPAVLRGANSAAAERLASADLCLRYTRRYRLAARLYAEAFAAEPKLAEDRAHGHRYDAACAASLAAAGKGKDVDNLDDKDRAKLRAQALAWLRADLAAWQEALERQPAAVVAIEHWQTDTDLAGVREQAELGRLPKDEHFAWRQLWADVEQLRKTARGSYTETTLKGSLTGKDAEQVHELKLTAGKTYVIDMIGEQFDSYLRLEDAQKKVLAENDDIAKDNLNSRIVFTPKKAGVFRLIATSFEQRGVGAYTLTIREFKSERDKDTK